MAAVKHRWSSLLMAKDQFTSPIPTSRYDTPGTFDKNPTVSQTIRLSICNLKVKPVLQTAQHMPKQVQELHTSKVKHAQLSHQNAEKIVSNRNVQWSKCSIFNQSTLQNTKSDN